MTARERLPDRCQLGVEHAVTADMDDGQALPPFWDGNAWHVVRRFPNQKTLWRRISLQTTQEGRIFDPRRQNSARHQIPCARGSMDHGYLFRGLCLPLEEFPHN
jgi:hypothetical protein